MTNTTKGNQQNKSSNIRNQKSNPIKSSTDKQADIFKRQQTRNTRPTNIDRRAPRSMQKLFEPKLSREEKDKLVDEITKLREEYKAKHGESVFNLQMPDIYKSQLSYRELRDILVKIVDTGETIYDGYYKYILKSKPTLDIY